MAYKYGIISPSLFFNEKPKHTSKNFKIRKGAGHLSLQLYPYRFLILSKPIKAISFCFLLLVGRLPLKAPFLDRVPIPVVGVRHYLHFLTISAN